MNNDYLSEYKSFRKSTRNCSQTETSICPLLIVMRAALKFNNAADNILVRNYKLTLLRINEFFFCNL